VEFSNHNANLTKVTNHLSVFRNIVTPGGYYEVGGTCKKELKFQFPTDLVDVPPRASSTTRGPTGTATPYGQCESFPLSFSFFVDAVGLVADS